MQQVSVDATLRRVREYQNSLDSAINVMLNLQSKEPDAASGCDKDSR